MCIVLCLCEILPYIPVELYHSRTMADEKSVNRCSGINVVDVVRDLLLGLRPGSQPPTLVHVWVWKFRVLGTSMAAEDPTIVFWNVPIATAGGWANMTDAEIEEQESLHALAAFNRFLDTCCSVMQLDETWPAGQRIILEQTRTNFEGAEVRVSIKLGRFNKSSSVEYPEATQLARNITVASNGVVFDSVTSAMSTFRRLTHGREVTSTVVSASAFLYRHKRVVFNDVNERFVPGTDLLVLDEEEQRLEDEEVANPNVAPVSAFISHAAGHDEKETDVDDMARASMGRIRRTESELRREYDPTKDTRRIEDVSKSSRDNDELHFLAQLSPFNEVLLRRMLLATSGESIHSFDSRVAADETAGGDIPLAATFHIHGRVVSKCMTCKGLFWIFADPDVMSQQVR